MSRAIRLRDGRPVDVWSVVEGARYNPGAVAMSPVRIQRRRTKGWRMPEGAVYVGRPSRWGNPFRVGDGLVGDDDLVAYRQVEPSSFLTREGAVAYFRGYVRSALKADPGCLAPLRGRDLVCWCPASQPCHADVLLELANR